jgi:sporulation protein YlmC with PRC-barrel domain
MPLGESKGRAGAKIDERFGGRGFQAAACKVCKLPCRSSPFGRAGRTEMPRAVRGTPACAATGWHERCSLYGRSHRRDPYIKEISMASRPKVLSAGTVTGDSVVNRQGEDLGKIEEIMLDIDEGRVAYAVLSFGGFLGIGDKLFAVPWKALRVDAGKDRFILDTPKEKLE